MIELSSLVSHPLKQVRQSMGGSSGEDALLQGLCRLLYDRQFSPNT
jgi:hypothetical protein